MSVCGAVEYHMSYVCVAVEARSSRNIIFEYEIISQKNRRKLSARRLHVPCRAVTVAADARAGELFSPESWGAGHGGVDNRNRAGVPKSDL